MHVHCGLFLMIGQKKNVTDVLSDEVATELKQAKCIESPKRGAYVITDRGLELLGTGVESLDRQSLMRYPEFCDFLNRSRKGKPSAPQSMINESSQSVVEEGESPEDVIEGAFRSIEAALVSDILEAIMQQSPAFFERLVVQLLLAMGYGDSFDESGSVTPLSNDGGIDGVIREDKLGFENIYIQAKRWDLNASVGRPDLQAFVGRFDGNGRDKGSFYHNGAILERRPSVCKYAACHKTCACGWRSARTFDGRP